MSSSHRMRQLPIMFAHCSIAAPVHRAVSGRPRPGRPTTCRGIAGVRPRRPPTAAASYDRRPPQPRLPRAPSPTRPAPPAPPTRVAARPSARRRIAPWAGGGGGYFRPITAPRSPGRAPGAASLPRVDLPPNAGSRGFALRPIRCSSVRLGRLSSSRGQLRSRGRIAACSGGRKAPRVGLPGGFLPLPVPWWPAYSCPPMANHPFLFVMPWKSQSPYGTLVLIRDWLLIRAQKCFQNRILFWANTGNTVN